MAFVSNKVKNLPPYLFSEFQRKKRQLEAKGIDVIDLGIGAPDLPTPEFVIDKMVEEARKPENHRYSTYSGCVEFKEAVAGYYKTQYDVDLDPETEVLALIGSKEGIANLVQAVINPGDTVLLPDPCYPVYRTAVHLADGNVVDLPLDSENGYTPRFERVAKEKLQNAKLMLLNYPSNPTSATVNVNTFLEAITFAKRNNLMLAHDAAYDLVTFQGYKAPSVLQAPNAKDYAVEFGSMSKSFSMTGWRIGYVVGNKSVIQALATLKSNIDTCQFLPIQKAAATALNSDLSAVAVNNKIYQGRMEKMHAALQQLGIDAEVPKGTIFIWAKVPKGYTSLSFVNHLLDEAGVIVTPGTAFGPSGEGYFRIALSVTTERLDEVVQRMKKLNVGEVPKT
ncbi:LL-diaminopimelate aminotransferase [Virgibacillus byunsanensis]|uniref:Aminotransferase n=1 Tax=Virgibacillus byunsanensis TaxID=570945 RepID=A0ABW3LR48_9BACI